MDNLERTLSAQIPAEVRRIAEILHENGFRAWIVGGCVRDILSAAARGQEEAHIGDWDLCSDALPEQVQKLFPRVIPTGIEHGTVTIVMKKQHFEVTTLRGERGHSDGRRPDEVFFVRELEKDLERRDFTVNAMAYDVVARTFHDPFDGLFDLRAKVLRAVGDPAARFAEDGLRVLRCARFCSTLGFSIEEATKAAIRPSLASFEKVAQERVRQEWFKALAGEFPGRFLKVLIDEGILSVTAPELFGAAWQKAKNENGSGISMVESALDEAPAEPILRLALLCVLGSDDEHALDTASIISRRLRLSRRESQRLTTLAKYDSLPDEVLEHPREAPGRRYLSEIGREHAPDVLEFQTYLAPHREESEREKRARRELLSTLKSGCPLSISDLAIDGRQLMSLAGVPPGPLLGETLRHLLARTQEDPSLNVTARLVDLAKSFVPTQTNDR